MDKTYNGLENDLALFAKFVFIYESIIGHNSKLSELGNIIGCAINCFDSKIKKYVQRSDIKNHCCPVKITNYHLNSYSRNTILDIQALIQHLMLVWLSFEIKSVYFINVCITQIYSLL